MGVDKCFCCFERSSSRQYQPTLRLLVWPTARRKFSQDLICGIGWVVIALDNANKERSIGVLAVEKSRQARATLQGGDARISVEPFSQPELARLEAVYWKPIETPKRVIMSGRSFRNDVWSQLASLHGTKRRAV